MDSHTKQVVLCFLLFFFNHEIDCYAFTSNKINNLDIKAWLWAKYEEYNMIKLNDSQSLFSKIIFENNYT